MRLNNLYKTWVLLIIFTLVLIHNLFPHNHQVREVFFTKKFQSEHKEHHGHNHKEFREELNSFLGRLFENYIQHGEHHENIDFRKGFSKSNFKYYGNGVLTFDTPICIIKSVRKNDCIVLTHFFITTEPHRGPPSFFH